MEKKRRERINNSLDELKLMILGAIKKDASYYSKLEKADILEMAVDHVRNLQRQIRSVHNPDVDPSAKYRAGFITCASEVTRMIMGFPGLDESVKFNVMKHLAKCCTEDKRPTVDENIKQEVAQGSNVPTDVRVEPLEKVKLKLDESNQDAKQRLFRSQEKIIDSLLGHNSITHCKVTEAATVAEKRLMYKHVLSTVGSAKMGMSTDSRMRRSHYLTRANRYHKDDQKLQQFFPNLKSYSKSPSAFLWNDTSHYDSSSRESLTNSIMSPSLPWNKATKLCSDSSKSTTCRSENSLIKPIPKLPDRYLITEGIRLMPATVLVPVQVGYASIDEGESNNQTEEQEIKRDVWRPWEREETVTNHSKVIKYQNLFFDVTSNQR